MCDIIPVRLQPATMHDGKKNGEMRFGGSARVPYRGQLWLGCTVQSRKRMWTPKAAEFENRNL